MGEKNFDEHGGGGGNLSIPCNNLSICQYIEAKFVTEIQLCIFYPKTKELVLLIYANEFMTSLVCSRP